MERSVEIARSIQRVFAVRLTDRIKAFTKQDSWFFARPLCQVV